MSRQPTQTRQVDFKPTSDKEKARFSLPTIFQILIGIVGLAVVIAGWFLFTAKSVRFTANTEAFAVEVSGGIIIPSGPSLLMRQGSYHVSANAAGYEDLVQVIEISDASSQLIELQFEPLPGRIAVQSSPEVTRVFEDGIEIAKTPVEFDLSQGKHTLTFRAPRYLEETVSIDVLGKQQRQEIEVELRPDWAVVTLPSTPSNIVVEIDGELTEYRTPGPIQVLSGERTLSLKVPGYQRWSDILYVQAGQQVQLEPVELVQIGGTVSVDSSPDGASVTLDGEYLGTTPFEVDLPSNERMQLNFLLAGHHPASRTLTLRPGEARTVSPRLMPVTGELVVETQPSGATIFVNGEDRGTTNQTLSLPVQEYEIALQKEGFAGYSKKVTIQADFPQLVQVRLLTYEEARLEAMRRVRTTPDGQELVLLEPSSILLGASRRQPGRRANEAFRTVELSRMFYLGIHEVTNRHFRQFASGHESGEYQGNTLDKDDQPVVNVSWRECVLYLNWLSTQEGLTPFYNIAKDGRISINASSLGYRLPTEAEWAWTARTVGKEPDLLLYPWGEEFPPPNRHGNYADRSAQHVVGRIIYNYNDNHIVSAPVGSFDPNDKGIYDLGGNVAEWTHDFYEIPNLNSRVSELGPREGEYRVVRGSSWKHGTIVDLRYSFRDYGTEAKEDRGFRVARYAE